KRAKTVAVIEVDQEVLKAVDEILTKDIDQIRVVTERSYSRFFMRYLDGGARTTVKAAGPEEFFADPVTWEINPKNQSLHALVSPSSPGNNKVLGFGADELFKSPQDWKKLFSGAQAEA